MSNPREIYLVVSTTPSGEKNIVSTYLDDIDLRVDVFFTLESAMQLQKEMYEFYKRDGMHYDVKRVEL